jgi:(heptosyl)LPS beta-1,4-glucosyltransferase
MRRTQTLGVVAISYNEELDLPGFLENLQPWVDEIVIVDDGSTDSTAAIASTAEGNVKFIVSPRKSGEYFAGQRNKGINLATSDWLLHMDIDERVTPELADEILQAIQDNTKDGYRYRRLNYFLHRPMQSGGWQDWNMIHLARRHLFHFEGMFHENCILDAPNERIGQLTAKMWHLNDSSYQARMCKSFAYCEEQAKRISEKYSQITWLHLLFLPLCDFFRKFFFKKGYRDGTLGFLFAMHSSGAMFRACALVWDDQNRVFRGDIENKVKIMWQQTSEVEHVNG